MKKYYINSSTKDRSVCSQIQRQQRSLFTPQEDLPPYPLQIVAIPERERLKPDWFCGLIHYGSSLKLGGQFTHEEAKEILETTRCWDFTLDKNRTPKCADKLLALAEKICARSSSSQPSKDGEVAR